MENEERVPMDEEQSPITEAPAAGEAPPFLYINLGL